MKDRRVRRSPGAEEKVKPAAVEKAMVLTVLLGPKPAPPLAMMAWAMPFARITC